MSTLSEIPLELLPHERSALEVASELELDELELSLSLSPPQPVKNAALLDSVKRNKQV
ncbi:MAG: hypothetical protein QM601_01340 [Pseudoxanthomonas sp.]